MKTVLISLITCLTTIGLFLIFNDFSQTDLVYVDVNKLVEGYKRTDVAKKEFDKKAAVLKANVDSLFSDWNNEIKLYEKERSSYSVNEIKLKQELLSAKQQQISGYQESVNKQIVEEDKRITQSVLNDINAYVKKHGERKGYKIIFGAIGGGNIMYGDKASDLTEEILKGLNAEYEKK